MDFIFGFIFGVVVVGYFLMHERIISRHRERVIDQLEKDKKFWRELSRERLERLQVPYNRVMESPLPENLTNL